MLSPLSSLRDKASAYKVWDGQLVGKSQGSLPAHRCWEKPAWQTMLVNIVASREEDAQDRVVHAVAESKEFSNKVVSPAVVLPCVCSDEVG